MHNDLSSFSRNDFHATTWINKLIQEIPEGENVESIISSMSMKLHMAAQDYSEQLETAMVESMSTMPRMVSEISRLQDQLKSMQDEMRVISDHIHSVDQRSVSGVEELSRLDHIKSNMDKCRSTLEEHARWSLLVREARLLLEGSGELAETADRIQVMHNSLEILRNLPGHEERKETYETFRSTLLNALTPNIRKEINDMSIATLQEYLYVYRKLHSYEDFVKEYIRNRPAAIINIWKTENSSSHQSFSEWFALFLGTVTKFLLDEENNIIELFGYDVAPSIENSMLKEILSDMKLQLSEKIQQKQQQEEKNKNNNTTNTMIAYECYCLLDEFMKRISFLLVKLTIIQRIDLFSFIFSSFQSYLPSYLLYDEKIMKESLLLNIQSISFQPQQLLTTNKPNNTNNNNNNNTFLGEDSMDELEQLNQFLESSSTAITDSFQYFNERLQYCSKIFGGSLLIREFSKYFIHSLLLFIKSMTLKFHCFAIALGIEKEITTISDTFSSSESSSYGNYLDEVKQAQRIATKLLATTEYDTQMFSLNVLKSLQLLGQFLKFISQLENQYRMICSDIQKNMIVLEGYFPNDIEGMMKKSLSFGHVYGSYYMIHHDQHLAELKSFLSNNAVVSSIGGNSASYSQGIFATITQPLKKLKIRIGNTLINLANQIPMKLMTSYSHEEILTRVIQNEEELEIAKMNLLPQTSITQVGEHILSWVQDLESFASSDAFQDLLILRGETLQLLPLSLGWSSLRSLIEINDEKLLSQLTERVSCAKLINAFERELIQTARSQGIKLSEFLQRINDPQSSGLDTLETDLLSTGDISNPGEVGGEGGNTLIFVNEWLSVIADSIVAIYLTTILRLSTISEIGALQLLTDIDYLSNVVNAVGIRPHPLLVFTRSLLVEERQPLTQCLQSLTGSGKSLGALKDLLKYSNLINQNLMNKKK